MAGLLRHQFTRARIFAWRLSTLSCRAVQSVLRCLARWVARRQAGRDRRVEIAEADIFDTAYLTGFLRSYDAEPDRVLIVVAQEAPEVRQAIDDLVSRGVPVVTLISDNTRSARRAFVGIDNFAAGRTAGALMGHVRARAEWCAGHFGPRPSRPALGFRAGDGRASGATDRREPDDDSQSEVLIRAAQTRSDVGLITQARMRGSPQALCALTVRPAMIAHELTPENRPHSRRAV
jgi:hypothetical protein